MPHWVWIAYLVTGVVMYVAALTVLGHSERTTAKVIGAAGPLSLIVVIILMLSDWINARRSQAKV